MELSVFFCDVSDDLIPSMVRKVYINIWHGYPLRIKKALKQELMLNWVSIGYIKDVRHHGSGRRSPAGAS
ncbi:Uncharacterised protein [Mycobacteroides abscessus subsp. abscessus]|nr:Uncharacterised protein [Mycobacteroides abscessus subsp. abscessus]